MDNLLLLIFVNNYPIFVRYRNKFCWRWYKLLLFIYILAVSLLHLHIYYLFHSFLIVWFCFQGILDASRQRHNILWRSKSETNLKSALGQSNQNKRDQNAKSNDCMDHSNNNKNLRKSSEELSTHDPSYNSMHVHIPTPSNLLNGGENRRPKSWSPDDHTAALLLPQNTENGE